MSALTGTAPLLRASLRHEARAFAPWIVLPAFLTVSSVLVYPWIFPEQADRAGLAAAVGGNPAIGIIFGPAFDLSTTDGFNAWRSLSLGGFLVALGAVFAVTKATRGQEDSGQAELLAAGVLGRASRLAAAVGVAFVASLLAGVVSGVLAVACGGDWSSSLLLAATFTASGWMFASVAAVTAQLGSDARTASSLAVGALAMLFLLRGFAYSVRAPEWTVWMNPMGWMTQTRPASGDHWWPLLPALAFTVVALAVAFALQARRDFGQGAIAPRPGHARGSVRSTWALAVRLNRGPFLTWVIAAAGLGVVFGYFASSAKELLDGDNAAATILARGAATSDAIVSAFVVTVLSLVGMICSVPGVQAMLKLRTEEDEDRVEPLLAGAVARPPFYLGHTALALLVSAVCVVVAGLVTAALAASADIGVSFWATVGQAIATVPATWTVVAVSVAVVGARPRVSIAAWLGVVASFALTLLGPTFKLWDWVLAISPFWHVPNVARGGSGWGLAWISLVTAFLLLVGVAGFRRRDLARH